MAAKPLISIIIPVYNVEDYIGECLSSIPLSIAEKLEIIVVNDGTQDNSMSVAKEFANKNAELNISLLNKENGGLSSARNMGILAATGKYIVFLDSDDMLEAVQFTKLVDLLQNSDSDIVIGDYYKFQNYEITPVFRNFEIKTLNSDSRMEAQRIFSSDYECVVWINAYKTDFIVSNKLFFTNGIYHEDVCWMPSVISTASSFCFSGLSWYIYRIREGSIMTTFNPKKDLDKFICGASIYNDAENTDSPELRNKLFKIANDCFRTPLRNLYKYSETDAEKIITEAEKYTFLLKKPVSLQNIIRHTAVRMLGVSGFSSIGRYFKKIKKRH
jgi:glycosyltransferase involved in cell wall biosynthesis